MARDKRKANEHRSRGLPLTMKRSATLIIFAFLVLQVAVACNGVADRNDATAEARSVFPQDEQDGATAGTPTAVSEQIISAANAEQLLLTNIYDRASTSVVNVESRYRDPLGTVTEVKRGSGFVYDQQGHIVTNAHLVKNADSITVTLLRSQVLEAQPLGTDSFSDLAVLKVVAAADRLAPLLIGESATLRVGQRVISIGSPFGLNNSMTVGIVSGLGRSLRLAELIEGETMPGFENPSIIQIDATINSGTSGGPLFDSQGFVIGITTAIRSDNGAFQGVGFAVPADTMRRVIPELIAKGSVDYAWMGLSVMREEGGYGVAGLSSVLGLPVERGVLLSGVSEGSPAQLAGLKGGHELVDIRAKQVCAGGDLIVAINDYYVENLDDLNTYLIQKTRPGDEIALLVIRDRQTFEAKLTLRSRPVTDNARTLDCNTVS